MRWKPWLVTGAWVLLSGWFLTGFYLTTEEGQRFVHGESRAARSLVEIKYPVFGWPLLAVRQNFEHFVTYSVEVPEVCWKGSTFNEFQERQCADFWYRLSASSVFVWGPVLLALLVILMLRTQAHAFRLAVRKKLSSKKGTFAARVSESRPAVGADLFAYWNSVAPVIVSRSDGKQKKVYFSQEGRHPGPGDWVAVFDLGNWSGQRRLVGTLADQKLVDKAD